MMKRVILVEDDANIADLLRRSFAEYVNGFATVVCPDALEMMNALRDKTDLIVLDLALPDSPTQNTVGLIAMLHDIAPVVVLTGKEVRESGIEKRCYGMGADTVWEKTALINGGTLYFVHACYCAIQRREAQNV